MKNASGLLAFAAAMLMGLQGCRSETDTPEPVLRAVRTLTIGEVAAGRTWTIAGISKAAQETRLSFKVGGSIVELPVQVGDQLQAGDLVARLDSAPFELQAQQAQATMAQASANERNAAANYERVKGLYENSNASRNDLDSARAAAESASAQVGVAQKALELARLNVQYTRLTASRDCAVASLAAELNENISSGAPVAVVNCGAGLEVDVSVPEGLISSIKRGLRAQVKFSALDGQVFDAEVSEVSVSSAGGGATFPVTLRLLEPGEVLRSGLAAEVTFSFAANAGIHVVPLAAAVHDGDGSFVYVAIADGDRQALIQRRQVSIGNLTDQGLEITGGLRAGDRVVTAGVSFIRDGQRVLAESPG